MKIEIRDRLGYRVQDVNIPEPLPPVLIWGDGVYIAGEGYYYEVAYYVIPDTSESGAHRLPDFV